MKRLFSKSKRQRLIYIMLIVWIVFGVAGFFLDTDFASLAAYYSTFAGPAMMYVWGETRRPHDRVGD